MKGSRIYTLIERDPELRVMAADLISHMFGTKKELKKWLKGVAGAGPDDYAFKSLTPREVRFARVRRQRRERAWKESRKNVFKEAMIDFAKEKFPEILAPGVRQ